MASQIPKNLSAFEVFNKKRKMAQTQPNAKKAKSTAGKPVKKKDFVSLATKNSKKLKLKKQKRKQVKVEENGHIPKLVLLKEENVPDPVKEGKELFQWMISSITSNEFFKKYWEKAPLHIKRNKPRFYSHIMSTPILDQVLRKNYILFQKNLDITSYTNGVRETHNPPGRALPSIVWDYYINGCSVRMLNPQTFIPKLHMLNATLQEYFGCFVGANSYLTPPDSQGFAPHYDDIEAFILQVEGRKRWRLYKPRTKNETLPRYSSKNFTDDEIGEPILDVVLEAGDLLYFPRGTIHQGDTFNSDKHSLHVTVSVYQKNSWADFLERLLPEALKHAATNDVKFRQGLPLKYLNYVGSVHSDKKEPKRQQFLEKTKSLLTNLITNHINIDKAADELASHHIHDFLPPVLNNIEEMCSVYESGERMCSDGVVKERVEIEPDTTVRLSRSHCARLVEEDGKIHLYYSCDNSKEYHEYEPQFLELDENFVPAIKEIIVQYPKYVKVEDLPIDGLDNKIQIVQDLWEKGIVISENPLPIVDE